MDNQFTYKGKPVFIDSQCAYYIDDNNRKICITLAAGGGGTRIRRVEVPIPPTPVLNGTFTLSQNGSVGTIQSGSGLIIPTNTSTGYPGNLRVRLKLSGSYPVGSLVQNFSGVGIWGTIKTAGIPSPLPTPGFIYDLDVLSNGNWAVGNGVNVYNVGTGGTTLDSVLAYATPIQWILTIPTSQAITTISFTSSNNPNTGITSTGTWIGGVNTITSVSASNGYSTGIGNSIAIGDKPLVNGFAAQVTAVNFATANSANNFELTWTKTGSGMATTTSWIIT